MLHDSENTADDGSRIFARRGRDGLAQIGASRFDVAGIRFFTDNEGADGAHDDVEEESEDEAEAESPEQDSDDDDGFDGEFDAKRARSLITKLRGQLKDKREAENKPKAEAEDPKLRGENLRLRVALRLGISEDLADRLRGASEEELVEDAQKLVDLISPEGKKLDDRTPKPRLRGGSKPDTEPEVSSEDVARAILGR